MLCGRCIYDSEVIPYMTIDPKTKQCNYCGEYDMMDKEYPNGQEGWKVLESITERIKKESENKRYDVVVGVSGGCDSSYMLHLCKELGLRPLAAHFDNTWNARVGVENLYKITKALGVDLYTDVCDSEEYNDIFRSCLLASIPESDLAADIGLPTTHYNACEKFGIRYIFEGHSFRTEGITPHGWVYMDAKYRDDIHKIYGKIKEVKSVPNLYLGKWFKWTVVNRIKKIRPLYYIDYHKEDAKKLLTEKYGWQWYGAHHGENRSACFANQYYLPLKFGMDLRYCEYSALIRSGQMTRDEGLQKIKEPQFLDETIIEEIKERLHFSDSEFKKVMSLPNKSYRDYKTYKSLFEKLKPFFWIMYKFALVPKSFYTKFTRRYK